MLGLRSFSCSNLLSIFVDFVEGLEGALPQGLHIDGAQNLEGLGRAARLAQQAAQTGRIRPAQGRAGVFAEQDLDRAVAIPEGLEKAPLDLTRPPDQP